MARRLGKLGGQPPYRTDSGVLFVSFVANAECACHLALGWPLPARVLDLSPHFRNLTNGRSTPEGKGLLGALRYYGLDTIGTKQKDAMRDRIMRGWPFTPEEQRADPARTAPSDVDALCRLLPRILPEIRANESISASRSTTASSPPYPPDGAPRRSDRHGNFPQLADKNSLARGARRHGAGDRRAIRRLCPQRRRRLDIQHGTVHRLSRARGHHGWPRLETGKLNMRRKTFEDMTKGWPQLEELRQLRHARDKMRRIKLAVGADGRNRLYRDHEEKCDLGHASRRRAVRATAWRGEASSDCTPLRLRTTLERPP